MSPLLTPLKFWSIKHQFYKEYNFIFPAVLAVLLVIILIFLPKVSPIFGEKGFLASLQNILAIIGGFFIAALTLVTSDKSEILTSKIGGKYPPTLNNEVLSRKRFLAYLFGYLSFSSFAILGVTILANMIVAGLAVWMSDGAIYWSKIAFISFIGFWLGHIVISTLLGLYYFTERLHISDKYVIFDAED